MLQSFVQPRAVMQAQDKNMQEKIITGSDWNEPNGPHSVLARQGLGSQRLLKGNIIYKRSLTPFKDGYLCVLGFLMPFLCHFFAIVENVNHIYNLK